MTQQEFADFLQQSPATLSSIFNGRTRPTLNIVDAIKTKIPDISIEWLLYGTGEKYPPHSQSSMNGSTEGADVSSEPMLLFDETRGASFPEQSYAPVAGTHQAATKGVHPSEQVRESIKIIEKEPRRVTEIRVYYDDQTYETFVPAKK